MPHWREVDPLRTAKPPIKPQNDDGLGLGVWLAIASALAFAAWLSWVLP